MTKYISFKKNNDLQKIREDFERWVITYRKQSTERYLQFPYNYKVTDVDTLWEAWQAAYEYYK